MRAVQIHEYGGRDVLRLDQIGTPEISSTQVLVKIKAASINPFDRKLREGFASAPLPFTLGGDFSGNIVSCGADVKNLSVSDAVFGSALVLARGSGSLAQYAAVEASRVAQKPPNVSFDEAAALPLVGSSAIQALDHHIRLQKGQSILIHGGAGGIGHVAVQLAHARDARVASTASTDDLEFVRKMGADIVIDYSHEKFEDIIHDFDAVLDTVGGDTFTRSFLVLKPGGTLVTMAGKPDEQLAQKHSVVALAQTTHTSAEHLSRLAHYVSDGAIRPHIADTFSLENAKEAFFLLEEGHARGKVVIEISPTLANP